MTRSVAWTRQFDDSTMIDVQVLHHDKRVSTVLSVRPVLSTDPLIVGDGSHALVEQVAMERFHRGSFLRRVSEALSRWEGHAYDGLAVELQGMED